MIYSVNFFSVPNLEELTRHNLCLTNIPLHDATRELILLQEQFGQDYQLAKNLEILTDKLQTTLGEREKAKQETDR